MIGYGLWKGEKLRFLQWLGLILALTGLVGLVLPGLSAPPLGSAFLMCVAGATWGVYSLRGRGAGDPTKVSAGNFLRAAPMAIILSLLLLKQLEIDIQNDDKALASNYDKHIEDASFFTAYNKKKAELDKLLEEWEVVQGEIDAL